MSRISIIHPSRGRPNQCYKTVLEWLSKADRSIDFEYIISLDSNEPYNITYHDEYEGLPALKNVKVLISPNKGAIDAVNAGAKEATGDILIVVSDDISCPLHWDTLLLESLNGQSDFCAKVNCTHHDWLITIPIMDRAYYERFGYIYYPEFKHIYADTDMTCMAWMLGRYLPIDLTFKHSQPRFGEREADAIDLKNSKTWNQGRELFTKRLASNFGLTGQLQKLPMDEIRKQGVRV